MNTMLNRIVLALCLLFCSAAFAHGGDNSATGLWAGLLHPVTGADHLIALLAIGFWAGQYDSTHTRRLIFVFTVTLVAGTLLAVEGLHALYIEEWLLGSLLLTGVIIAVAAKLSFTAGLTLMALFAFFHGHAHGTELPQGSEITSYLAGIAGSSSVLLLTAQFIAKVAEKTGSLKAQRYVGLGFVVTGLTLLI